MQRQTKTQCYLRTHRLLWGLTLEDMARLMGLKDASYISLIEKGKARPTLRVALACQVVFNRSPAEMFPHAYGLAEDRIIGNMGPMVLALEKKNSDRSRLKRKLFHQALYRARPSEAGA